MINKSFPLVTVIMPIYNSENYVGEAISSILNQTYQNIELLAINDTSTDKSLDIIKSFEDKRIKIVTNLKNLHVAASMNKGLKLAKGKYIARMDSDDVSLPDRVKKQVDFLESNQEIGVVGGSVRLKGDMGGKIWKFPTDSNRVKHDLIFYNTLAQPTVMMRKEYFYKYRLRYDESRLLSKQKCEDYELWTRCVDIFPCANLDEVLLDYRVTRNKIHNDIKEQESPIKIRKHQLLKYGFRPTHKELLIHQKIATQKISLKDIDLVEDWLIKLGQESDLRPTLAYQWMIIPRYLWQLNGHALKRFIVSPISSWLPLSTRFQLIKMSLIKFGSWLKQRYTR